MSALSEASLTSMKAAFPAAPDSIQGIPTLASLIDLMLHICRCSQTQKTSASATMNMVFCAASPGLYSFFTTEANPTTFFPFLICMKQLNMVFLHMFDWFITKYGKTTTEDCEENRQRMAADWHPSIGFEPLTMRLFIGASYARTRARRAT